MRGPGQTEVLSQRAALVITPEQAPALQFRDDERDKIVEAARQGGRHDVEAVRAVSFEALLQGVSDLSGRPNYHPMAAGTGRTQIQLANGQALPPSEAQKELLTALAAIGFRQFRHWRVVRKRR